MFFVEWIIDKCGVGHQNWFVFCSFLFLDGASDIFTVISEDLAGLDFILFGLI